MFQYSDFFFLFFYLMEYDSKLSIHLAKKSCKIIYPEQNSVLQTSPTSRKKIKNGVWIFLEFGAGPQEANHKCEKFFCLFVSCFALNYSCGFCIPFHTIPLLVLIRSALNYLLVTKQISLCCFVWMVLLLSACCGK